MNNSTIFRFVLVIVAGATVLPFLPLIIQSFAFQWFWPDLLPDSWWWQARDSVTLPLAWDYVFSSYSRLWPAMMNTLIIAIGATGLALIICLPSARIIAKLTGSKALVVTLFYALPLLLPEITFALALLSVFIHWQLAGTLLAVILAHLIPVIPYMLRLLVQSFQRLDQDLESQAVLLGASKVQMYRFITLPLLLPGILAGCLFSFLVSGNLFLLTFMVGQGNIDTLPTLIFSKLSGGSIDASGAGLTLLSMVPGIMLLLLLEPYMSHMLGQDKQRQP